MDLRPIDAMQDDRSLVSTPSQFSDCSQGPSRPVSTQSNTKADGGGPISPSFPSPEQDAALTVLKDCNEDTVIAWLALLRSIEWKPGPGPGPLSSDQLDALNTLKDCENGYVLAGLRTKALGDNVPSRATSKRSTASSRYTRRSSARSSLRSSTSSFGGSSPHNNAYCHSSPRSSLGQGTLYNVEEAKHPHWCTSSEHDHRNVINTCDGWKRHEKEHEKAYPCMPKGPVEQSESGLCCALCGVQNPAQEHLVQHKISACIGANKLTRTRKSNLVKHLATHGISKIDANRLAERWRYKPNKKAYSCGFCIKLFANLTDWLNHIDHQHWSNGEVKAAWSLTTVIKGLLLQPKVRDAWQSLLKSQPNLSESSFIWKLPTAEGLQLRLELGEESEQELALAALRLGTDNSNIANQSHSAPFATSGEQQTDVGSYWSGGRVPSADRPPDVGSTPNATFAQRAGIFSKHSRGPPLSNMNTSRVEMYSSPFTQQNVSFFTKSRSPNYNTFPTDVTMDTSPFLDSASDMVQQPWSRSMPPSSKSPAVDDDGDLIHMTNERDHSTLPGMSFPIDVADTDAGQAFSPSFAPTYQQSPSPSDHLHHTHNPSMLAIPFDDDADPMRHQFDLGFHGAKPRTASPAQLLEHANLDFNFI